MTGFKETNEIKSNTKFADSKLWQNLKYGCEKIVDFMENQMDNPMMYCPRNNGRWTNELGNSKWCPDKNYIPQKCNPDNLTWGQIMKKFNIDGINYRNGEPDFRPVSRGEVRINDFSSNRSDNWDKAYIGLAKKRGCRPEEVKRWCRDNNITLHECGDMRTIQKVPRIIHANMSHNGGVHNAKNRGL